ncbi:hypothetical protein [Egicoccus halophilus]|uniref:Uncharacterized protein n=1 Tax=Egicoccus halophilus TaxID=1670830 RepID=A0A8J3A5X9_9ACTN|nr:hypothetical protein [Egicoccus halophilus]GGI03989.1 hypothetical protein GCM10011354_06810 [Egicoccus halophilus]
MGAEQPTDGLRELASAVHALAKAVEVLARAQGDVEAANLAGEAKREAHYLC